MKERFFHDLTNYILLFKNGVVQKYISIEIAGRYVKLCVPLDLLSSKQLCLHTLKIVLSSILFAHDCRSKI